MNKYQIYVVDFSSGAIMSLKLDECNSKSTFCASREWEIKIL